MCLKHKTRFAVVIKCCDFELHFFSLFVLSAIFCCCDFVVHLRFKIIYIGILTKLSIIQQINAPRQVIARNFYYLWSDDDDTEKISAWIDDSFLTILKIQFWIYNTKSLLLYVNLLRKKLHSIICFAIELDHWESMNSHLLLLLLLLLWNALEWSE